MNFRTLIASVLLVSLASGCSLFRSKKDADGQPRSCYAAKEFITTLEFMRNHKEFAYPEPDSQRLANQVAAGCDGAAGRFIRVTNLLLKAEAASRDAVSMGLKFAGRSDKEAQTFIEVFRSAYLEDRLDLDLDSAVNLAKSLSSEFNGDSEAARNDFAKFVSFCVSTKSLDLPRPKCAALGARLAKKTELTGESIFKPYQELYDFLRSSGGPGLNMKAALETAEDVAAGGDSAVKSFIQGYKYAVSSSGLGYDTRNALDFARNLAKTATPAKEKPAQNKQASAQ